MAAPQLILNHVLLDLSLLLFGLAAITASSFAGETLGLLLLFCGAGLACFGLFSLGFSLTGKPFTIKLKRIREDRRGSAWLWAAALATIVMVPFVWFMVMYPTHLIIEYVQSQYAFTGSNLQLVNLGLWTLDFALGFCVFGVVFWVLVNSNWRDTQYNY